MTFNDYILTAEGAYASDSELRIGQAYFNALCFARPELAEAVRGTAVDPFYVDGRLPQFLAYVGSSWED